MKMCHKTCVFFFFPITNKYLCMAKRSLLSRCPSYFVKNTAGIYVHYCIQKIEPSSQKASMTGVIIPGEEYWPNWSGKYSGVRGPG